MAHLDREVFAVDFPQRGLGQLLHLVPERHLVGDGGFTWSRQAACGAGAYVRTITPYWTTGQKSGHFRHFSELGIFVL